MQGHKRISTVTYSLGVATFLDLGVDFFFAAVLGFLGPATFLGLVAFLVAVFLGSWNCNLATDNVLALSKVPCCKLHNCQINAFKLTDFFLGADFFLGSDFFLGADFFVGAAFFLGKDFFLGAAFFLGGAVFFLRAFLGLEAFFL